MQYEEVEVRESSSWGFSFGGVRLWLSSLQLVAKVLVEHGIKQRVWTALIRKGAESAEVTCVFSFDGEAALQLKHTHGGQIPVTT